VWEKSVGKEALVLASPLSNEAVISTLQGKCAEAEPVFRRVLAIRQKGLGRDHPDVAQTLENLAVVLHALDRNLEADDCEVRAKAIRARIAGGGSTK
jgi:hypothetical protein